jgi:hypothetical protein
MKAWPLVIAASVITCAGLARAQTPADGVFVSAPNGVVWKSAAAYDQWQRGGGQGHRQAVSESLIACRVEPGTSFVVQYAIPPHGYGIEVIEGASRGCRGVAMNETVQLHKPMTDATKATPREKPTIGIGRSDPAKRPQPPGPTLRPLVPPLPPGGAVPVPPILR